MEHATLDDETRSQISEYAMGTLDVGFRRALEQHLEGCALCRRELAVQHRLVGELAAVAREAEPSRDVWTAIEAAVRTPETRAGAETPDARPWRAWASDAGPRAGEFTLVRDSEAAWEPAGAPGVEARRLHVDRSRNTATMLVRMAPGTSYPAHRHGGREECFVLSGDLRVGDQLVMHSGDYQRAELGSVHPVQSTENGCLLLLVSSL